MNANLSRTLFRQAALVVAAVVTMAAIPALAESPTVGTEIEHAVLMKSSGDLRAELEQARRDGWLRAWSASYNPLLAARSLKTRAKVRAEREGSRHLPSKIAEDGGSMAKVMPRHQGAAIHVAQR